MVDGLTPTEAVHTYYEYIDEGDIDSLVTLFAPDVVYDRPGHPRIEGRTALERFYREVRPLSDGEHSIHSVLADGREVATRGTFQGVQNDTTVRLGFSDFFIFDEDLRVQSRFTYTDRDTV